MHDIWKIVMINLTLILSCEALRNKLPGLLDLQFGSQKQANYNVSSFVARIFQFWLVMHENIF